MNALKISAEEAGRLNEIRIELQILADEVRHIVEQAANYVDLAAEELSSVIEEIEEAELEQDAIDAEGVVAS